MARIDADICVIGAGSGGLSVAYAASQMGARVVLIEAGRMGGDCLNYGCVPSKSLLAAGKVAHWQGTSERFGIAPVTPGVDFAAVKDHVRGVIEAIAPHDSEERYHDLGVRVIRARARFVSDRVIAAGGDRIVARRFVVATGSSPFVPPIEGLEDVPYETNETIFDLRTAPGHLLIVGGGPVGVELAQAHLRLGCAVSVVAGGGLLPRDDPELVGLVRERLLAEGARLVEGERAHAMRGRGGDLTLETDGGTVLHGTHLLVAAGRSANVDDLGLEAAGVTFDRHGVSVDARLRTGNRRIYAVGDAAGGPNFTHVASYHAGVVVRQIVLGLPARASGAHLPHVTFTDPELAQVGLTEAEARERYGARVTVARFNYSGNDRAQAERRTQGFAKIMVVGGRPVGAAIVGAGAGELVGLWSLVIANRLKLSAVSRMIAPYPTLSEVNGRVAGAYFSPKLFDSVPVKRLVRAIQRFLP